MIKRKLALLLCLALIATLSFTNVYAQHDPAKKFVTGVSDVVASPLELGKSVSGKMDEHKENNVLGFFVGLVAGAGEIMHKVVGGVGKMFTFPFQSSEE